jgi:hypothetical protein
MASSGMIRHLATCPARQEAVARANASDGKTDTLYHLRVAADERSEYWLDLEMTGSARLEALDKYLRAIWLECCGHLSQFSIKGWRGPTIAKNRTAAQVFEDGVEVTHIYDFGSSSETLIRPVAARVGKSLTRHAVFLMARNLRPVYPCIECGEPAGWLCMECVLEDQEWGCLCATHRDSHGHTNYGEPIALVNSPRLGTCGYDGPAEPPY